jgi:D-alanyl-D-alanine carboxypeptidase (penicillin-binding protein 5/6)
VTGRAHLILALLLGLTGGPAIGQPADPPRSPADRPDGPPVVTAKGWVVADGVTGRVLWGSAEAEARPIASTTKLMTARIVLG